MIHARRGQWLAAITNLTKVVELAPKDHLAYHLLAPVLLQAGDLAGYHQHRARVLRQFRDTSEPNIAERMAKDCLLVPPSAADLKTLSKMTDVAVAAGPGHRSWPYFQLVKGLLEYRLGHFTNAVEEFAEVQAWGGNPNSYRTAQADLLVAMAQYQLKQPEQARASLAIGVERINTKLAKLERGLDEQWDDWLRVQILLREAKSLIEGEQPSSAH